MERRTKPVDSEAGIVEREAAIAAEPPEPRVSREAGVERAIGLVETRGHILKDVRLNRFEELVPPADLRDHPVLRSEPQVRLYPRSQQPVVEPAAGLHRLL